MLLYQAHSFFLFVQPQKSGADERTNERNKKRAMAGTQLQNYYCMNEQQKENDDWRM